MCGQRCISTPGSYTCRCPIPLTCTRRP
ncbi:hypothetical protein ACFLXV_02950 [Chloroflexota bacterium]